MKVTLNRKYNRKRIQKTTNTNLETDSINIIKNRTECVQSPSETSENVKSFYKHLCAMRQEMLNS
jgi:hypothetical protein